MKKILRIFALVVAVAFAAGSFPMAASSPSKGKVRTMIVAGQDGNHWWKGGCEAMKLILENTGLFTVDFCFTPSWDGDMETFRPSFKDYDLVVVNYGGNSWAESTRKEFEKFVENGGGVVFLHSSIIPHEDWPAWNMMTGLGAWNGRDEKWGPMLYLKDGKYIYDYSPGWAGYHGLQHQSVVDNVAISHPILKGLPSRWRHFKDEIYLNLRGPAKNIEILCTTPDRGRDNPVMWTVSYGKGRVFVDVLGHCGNDPELSYSMTCTGFQETFTRGCLWAATGEVGLPVPQDFPTEDTVTFRMDFRAPFNAYPQN